MAYCKVFPTMYTGSMYGAGIHVFAAWTWILAHKDEEGVLEINPSVVAAELGGTVKEILDALKYLTAEDLNSRSPDNNGKRLIRTGQFSYQVVNHMKYRELGKDRREYWRKYYAEKRQKTENV